MQRPQIFYLCYDHQRPSGGQKQMYRHVDILNKHDYQAFALHMERGFRLTWFSNETNVICLEDFGKIYKPEYDFMVLPEDLGENIPSLPGKKVIFNQGVYLGFYSLGLKKIRTYPCLHPDVKAVMVVSDHNRNYLEFSYPDLDIHRVYNGIEPDKFIYNPIYEKKKRITCLPSKNPVDLSQVYHISISRSNKGLNHLRDYEWIFIDNMPEEGLIEILSDSLIFIFLSTEEGFGRTLLEAMLSGSLVLAYNSGPLTEYLCDSNSFLSQKGDVLDVVRNMEKIAHFFDEKNRFLEQISQKSLESASYYSVEREEKSVIHTWEEIINNSKK